MLWSHSWLVEIKETSESDFQIKIFRIVKENKNLWNFNWFKWNKHVVMKKNPLAILQVWSVTPDTENSADGTHTAGHLAQRKKLEAGGNENVAQLRGRTRSEAGVTRRNWWFLLFFFFYYFIIHLCIQGLGHFSWQFSKAGKRHKPPDTQCPHRPRCFVVKPQHGWGWRESENQTSKATEKQWAQSSRWLAAWNSSMGPRERSQHPRILYPAKLSLRSDVKWMFLAPLPRTIPEKSPK
jgi:hypothetical protein